MPFVPTVMTSYMLSKAASYGMSGAKDQPLFSATASAVCSYIPMAATVVSTNVVVGPGSGTYTGKIIGCVPDLMSSMMLMKTASAGIMGTQMKRFLDVISFGVCQTMLTTAIAQGSVIGGGPGTGQGKILGLIPSVLEQVIMANLGGKLLFGSKTVPLVSAIAFGICSHIMTSATVMTTCIGSFAPPPTGPVTIPAAPGPGRLI
jgi:hypothetical protein